MMNVLEQVHQMVWGPWTLVIFLGVGIFFTLKCHFFQIRGFLFWWILVAIPTTYSIINNYEMRAANIRKFLPAVIVSGTLE